MASFMPLICLDELVEPRGIFLAAEFCSRGHNRSGPRGQQIARDLGSTEMVVSATPSVNTVRFYLARGFQPTGLPLDELLQLEPADIHMRKVLNML